MNRPGCEGEHQLQRRFETVQRAESFYSRQVLDKLNPLMRKFIARQEMVFIATADKNGECDCSFRAGLPGFVRVLDGKTLLYPEYRGNGVMASLGNIEENPHIGMIFVDFFDSTLGLHINGEAEIIDNVRVKDLPSCPEDVLREMNVSGRKVPELWVRVTLEEAYLHCAKHVPRLEKLPKKIGWGTDDEAKKGGDYFRSAKSN